MAQSENKNEYRSERKQRLARVAKKRNGKKVDSTKLASVIISVICVLALLAGVAGGLYVYGIPQKFMPAVTVAGRTYSVAEYSYYYTTVYQSYANQSYSYYENYGFSVGFDYKKDPSAQTTTDDDGNEITYDEFFKNQVLSTLESYSYYLDKAKEEGITLNEENKTAIDDNIADLATYASQYGYSTGRYISVLYGKGLNEKKLRSLMEEQYLVSQYAEKITDDASSVITAEEIEAEYQNDPSAYDQVDVRLFGLAIETEETTDEETTVEEATVEETTAEATTAAETTVAETTAVETTAVADDTQTTAQAETTVAEETTTEEKEPTAQELLAKEMLDRITDEASFVELAKEYCAEEDAETFQEDSATRLIGLKKSIVKSNIDEDLAEWLFNAERQVGDKTMVTTDEYVYVLYLTKTAYRNEVPLVSARHILVSFDTVQSELEADTTDTTDETDTSEETTVADEETTVEAQDDTKITDTTEAETAETATDALTATDGTVLTNNYDYSNEVLVEAYNQALDILAEYNEGEKTEEAFAALAETYSADTGSIGDNGEGGLYEDIARGSYVEEFENWVYDETRQPGDVGIIISSYGVHVMYFVSTAEEAAYAAAIRETLASNTVTAQEEAITEQVKGTAKLAVFGEFAAKQALKLVNKLYGSTDET